MPPPSATTDEFAALAEPRRRLIMDRLIEGELAVNGIVERTPMDQPTVSKHLRILREAGLVHVRRDGRRRLYAVNGEAIKRMHDWAARFEAYWTNQLGVIKELAEAGAEEAPVPTRSTRKARKSP